MITRITLFVLFFGTSQLVLSEEGRSSPGNPPQVLLAESIDADGNLGVVSYRTIYIGFDGSSYNHRSVQDVTLNEVEIQTVGGTAVSLEKARDLLLKETETAILALDYGASLPDAYKVLFSNDALVFVFPKKSPRWNEIQDPEQSVR